MSDKPKTSLSAQSSNGKTTLFGRKNLFGLTDGKMTFLVCAVCFILVMIVQTEPLYPFNEAVLGHDFQYHYLRTDALAYKIDKGEFFTGGIDYLFNGGAGYASSTAYPDLMLIIPALLRNAGMGIGNSMSVFIIICSILTYMSMFFSVKGITKSPVCASLACVVSMLTFYRMDNIYTRFALGEVQAYIFWPLVFYGLYNLIFEDFRKPYIIAAGFAGLLMTHTISTVIAAGVSAVTVIIFFSEFVKNPKKLVRLIITALVTLALTAYYWIPLFELLGSCELTYKYPYALSENNTVPFWNIFRDLSIEGMGIMLLMLQLPRILLVRDSVIRKKTENDVSDFKNILKLADVFLVLALVLCFFISDKAPWGILKHALNFMQFAWRMYGAATMLMSFSAAVYLYYVFRFADIKRAGLIVISVCSCLNFAVHSDLVNYGKFYALESDYYLRTENTYNVGYGEWLPWASKCAIYDNEESYRFASTHIITDSGETLEGLKSAGEISFEIPPERCSYVDVPLTWYKGYSASDQSGNDLEITMSDKGFVRVDTSSASGTVEVKYSVTSVSVCSYIISAVSAAGLVAFGIITLKKKKAEKQNDRKEPEKIAD